MSQNSRIPIRRSVHFHGRLIAVQAKKPSGQQDIVM
jgi:hypothetical protein